MKSTRIDIRKQKNNKMMIKQRTLQLIGLMAVAMFCLTTTVHSQELMEVDGGIKVGNTTLMQDGTIRYNAGDLEGLVGGLWKSLTTSGETTTTLINNSDGTFTYTSEDGTVTTFDVNAWETITSLVDNNDGTATYTAEDGTMTTINTSQETITTLVDNNDGTVTYTSEDGTATTVSLGSGSTSGIWMQTDSIAHHDPTVTKVIIGDTSLIDTPGEYNLYVEDGILTEKVKVAIESTSDWADDAFYRVPSIDQVEESIKTNSHLYNVPSAQALVDKGYSVTEMDARILEQTEWLWMHVIELKKENEELKVLLQDLLYKKK